MTATEISQPTIVNMCNHAFWNLSGYKNQTILSHKFLLNSSEVCLTDQNLLPTGQLKNVTGTCMDFRSEVLLSDQLKRMEKEDPVGWTTANGGIDHCFLVDGAGMGGMVRAAKVREEGSGRVETPSVPIGPMIPVRDR